MSRRRRNASVAANPVLIGAATILVVLVAVFLAYNANNGLPFVPTYQVKAELPSAANLVVGNDVRIGGARVGVVSEIKPKIYRTGKVTALVTLKLQTSVKPLDADTTVLVRPRSALGLKYVQVTPGRQGGHIADGGTLPLANARPAPVELDEVFNTFDAKTRTAIQHNLVSFGNGFAGRGADLQLAIHDLAPLLRNLVPVSQNLADPRTGLATFVQALARTASIVAPAAETQASLFRNLDSTFLALAGVARPYIQDSISGGPPALDQATSTFRAVRPFLTNSAALFHELQPGARALGSSAPVISSALVAGTSTLKRIDPFNRKLADSLVALRNFAQDPLVPVGIHGLRNTAETLNPTVAFLTPMQTTCNYVSLWFRNVASLLSEGDKNGTWQRFIIIATPAGINSETSFSSAPANGPTADNHLHTNPYPNTASPGQTKECEAANERYLKGQTVIGNQPGNQGTQHDVSTINRTN
ncbi:MAG: Mammalian cell entry related domain protein [Solirubrobacterales bacterium]|nr:Mammalian cell entry related domain protein [Solirubrobacterales bacterium]